MPTHMYIHVPFCKSICYYCDFCHVVYQEALVDKWLHALEKELMERNIPTELDTIYIGGGTPTSLSYSQLDMLLSLLDKYSSKIEEYTIEANPETLTEEKCELLKRHGINRASIGLQTSDPTLLASIGRKHTFESVRRSLQQLHQVGITNISLDIMYSLPDQTMQNLKQTVQDALSLQPTHLSLYSLTIEEKTVFGKRGIAPLDEDTEADMYEWICQYLPENGLQQYEISNFCKEGYASKHNLGYWHYDDFYGVSCGASGKEGHTRYDNVKNVMKYIEDPFSKEVLSLTKQDERFEMIMMGLRLKEGVDLVRYHQMFEEDYRLHYGQVTDRLVQKGLLEVKENYVRCTEKGFPILNDVLVEMMEGE